MYPRYQPTHVGSILILNESARTSVADNFAIRAQFKWVKWYRWWWWWWWYTLHDPIHEVLTHYCVLINLLYFFLPKLVLAKLLVGPCFISLYLSWTETCRDNSHVPCVWIKNQLSFISFTAAKFLEYYRGSGGRRWSFNYQCHFQLNEDIKFHFVNIIEGNILRSYHVYLRLVLDILN